MFCLFHQSSLICFGFIITWSSILYIITTIRLLLLLILLFHFVRFSLLYLLLWHKCHTLWHNYEHVIYMFVVAHVSPVTCGTQPSTNCKIPLHCDLSIISTSLFALLVIIHDGYIIIYLYSAIVSQKRSDFCDPGARWLAGQWMPCAKRWPLPDGSPHPW